MNLLIQPGDGSKALLDGINGATKSIELVIFRFDRREIEDALRAAAARGVFIHTLVTYTNRGGEKHLRQLEQRLLEAGVTVARTAGDLSRYHNKLMIIDRRVLFLLAFNFTSMDIDHSRSFGLVTEEGGFVREAVKLFEADTTRQPYTADLDTFVVSPVNARKQLAEFIEGAQERLWIYDPQITDKQMMRLLQERAKAGVDVRVIGRAGKGGADLSARKLSTMRLHTRTIIRDQRQAFVGSQSLRRAELDQRREVGLIVDSPEVVGKLAATFESDWASADNVTEQRDMPTLKVVKKAVKSVMKDLPPVSTIIKDAVEGLTAEEGGATLDSKQIEDTVKAIKMAVKESVAEAILEGARET